MPEFQRKYPHPTKKFEPLVHATAVTVFYIYIWIRDFLIALWDIVDLLLAPAGKERPAKPLVVRTPEERYEYLPHIASTTILRE